MYLVATGLINELAKYHKNSLPKDFMYLYDLWVKLPSVWGFVGVEKSIRCVITVNQVW